MSPIIISMKIFKKKMFLYVYIYITLCFSKNKQLLNIARNFRIGQISIKRFHITLFYFFYIVLLFSVIFTLNILFVFHSLYLLMIIMSVNSFVTKCKILYRNSLHTPFIASFSCTIILSIKIDCC